MIWETIESAPKDGSLILAWVNRAPMIAFWGRTDVWNPPGWHGGHCHINHINQPTHWTPLQPPDGLPMPLAGGIVVGGDWDGKD